jgi:PAS domain S-box-containing protein
MEADAFQRSPRCRRRGESWGTLPVTDTKPVASVRPSELLHAIVDASPFATMAFDRDRKIIFWSNGAERVFGWSADEVLGRPFPAEISDESERGPASERIERTLAGAVINGDLVHRRARDGRELVLEIYASPLRDAHGASIGYAGQMIDVTDRQHDLSQLRAMEADRILEAGVRKALGDALASLLPDASLEQAAQVVCDELTNLPGIDFTAVGAFLGPDDAVLIASRAPKGFPVRVGDHLPAHRARRLWTLASEGPWAEYWASTSEDGAWGAGLDRVGLQAFAFGPLVHGDHVDGGIVIGTRDAAFARTLVEKMPALVDVSTTPSALLAERLHAYWQALEQRKVFATLLAEQAFHPVYQPIVELASAEIVGYEALTRFHSGQPPEQAFSAARAAGLGIELELATLERAIDGARRLPAGRWLDLNVSPSLLEQPAQLRERLWSADRPLVLEITEHEVVADYAALHAAVRSLGGDVRLAVDDAGAGIANFGHILELGADFVKLDISLVRRVNANLGRQALVVAMRHFARTAGCRLVAEGIETAEEARTLRELGVEFGQGYWFGRPEPAPLEA